jgi:hypothetical protein
MEKLEDLKIEKLIQWKLNFESGFDYPPRPSCSARVNLKTDH